MDKPKPKRLEGPSDPLQLADLTGDIAPGQIKAEEPTEPTPDDIRRILSALGKIGGAKGGRASAEKLSEKSVGYR
jgi:hypothetical protein